MTTKRQTSSLWTPMDLWIVRASRYLARGRLIPLREFERLSKDAFLMRGFLNKFAPFFREEQKPLLRRSWQRWIQWKKGRESVWDGRGG